MVATVSPRGSGHFAMQLLGCSNWFVDWLLLCKVIKFVFMLPSVLISLEEMSTQAFIWVFSKKSNILYVVYW